jgi:hypothetical protein
MWNKFRAAARLGADALRVRLLVGKQSVTVDAASVNVYK